MGDLCERADASGLSSEDMLSLPRPSAETYSHLPDRALALFYSGQGTAAEELLLKTFLLHTQPEGFSFDLVIGLYEQLSAVKKFELQSLARRRVLGR